MRRRGKDGLKINRQRHYVRKKVNQRIWCENFINEFYPVNRFSEGHFFDFPSTTWKYRQFTRIERVIFFSCQGVKCRYSPWAKRFRGVIRPERSPHVFLLPKTLNLKKKSGGHLSVVAFGSERPLTENIYSFWNVFPATLNTTFKGFNFIEL